MEKIFFNCSYLKNITFKYINFYKPAIINEMNKYNYYLSNINFLNINFFDSVSLTD